jgi:hypothetical protein
MKKSAILIFFVALAIYGRSQGPQIIWSDCIGGSSVDLACEVKTLSSGDFIIAGYSQSADGDVSQNKGQTDALVVKIDSWGDTSWVKTFGGTENDKFYSVIEAFDGGYLLAGSTFSSDGDVHGNQGSLDAWLVKVDENGDTLWTKCYGGSSNDCFNTVIATPDSSYLLTGWTMSEGNGWWDVWVVKINISGDTLWSKSYGGSSFDEGREVIATGDSGYIVVGYTKSHQARNYHGGADMWVLKLDADGDTLWTNALGGSRDEYANAIMQTADNGYIVGGYTNSNDGDVHGWHEGYNRLGTETSDAWLVKLNASGDTLWTKCMGGTGQEEIKQLIKTGDEGFIMAGKATSDDGDVTGWHEGRDPWGDGYSDAWLSKLNYSGDTIWTKCLGDTSRDDLYSIAKTNDGGYLVDVYSSSDGGEVPGNHGGGDIWMVKILNENRNIFTKSLGGTDGDYANSISETYDKGFIIAGYTESDDYDVHGNYGNFDGWIVKLNSDGDTLWTKCLGGSSYDKLNKIRQTPDSNFVLAGRTYSNDGDVNANNGGYDFWIVKISRQGNILWSKCYGGSNDEEAVDVIPVEDGGYIVTGYTESNDKDVSGNQGDKDVWVLKIDAWGNYKWAKCLGGSSYDAASKICQTWDKNFLIAGSTSSNDGDVHGWHEGYASTVPTTDAWVVKINEYGDTLWTRCFGGTDKDYAYDIVPSHTGTFIVAGQTKSNDGDVHGNHGKLDGWAFMFDTAGDTLWTKCYGGSGSEMFKYLMKSNDGTHLLAGYTCSNDGDVHHKHGGEFAADGWMVKINPDNDTLWTRCVGGTSSDYVNSVAHDNDGGYIIAGYSASEDGDVYGNYGHYDYWVLKIIPPLVANQTVRHKYNCKDGNASMAIQPEGLRPLKYQWQKDGTDIFSANDSLLIINNVSKDDYGSYRCIVLNTLMETDTSKEITFPVIPEGEISLVTIDPIKRKNKIILNKCDEENITSYDIFKETFNNQYGLIGNIHKDSILNYIDYSSVPRYSAKKYKVAIVDTCGFQGDLSYYHKDMLTEYTFEDDRNILEWDQYVDESGSFVPNKYYVFRGMDDQNLSLYDSVDISYDFFVDNNVTDSIFYYYRVAVKRYDSLGIRYAFSNINDCKAPNVMFSIASNCYPDTTLFINKSIDNVYHNTHFEWDIDNDGSFDYQTKDASHIYPSGGEFTVKLRATNAWCSDELEKAIHIYVTPNISMIPAHDTTLCQNTMVNVSANINNYDPDRSYDYFWSNGSYLPEITVSKTGKYYVTVANGNCISKDSSGYINFVEPFSEAEICLVTVDEETGYNKILWERDMHKGIEYYNVYKAVGNNYTPVGSVPFGEMSMFIDYYSKPEQVAARYAISTVDTCGNESSKSPFHQTIHLGASEGATPGTYVLDWTDYIDESGIFTPNWYYIYRGNSVDALILHDSVSGIYTEWNDNDPQGQRYYRIAIEKETGCFPSDATKANAGPFSQSISNLEDNRLKENSVNYTFAESRFAVYPNPASKKTYIRFSLAKASHVDISLYSVTGIFITRIINKNIPAGRHTIEYFLDDVAAGIYYIKLANNGAVFTNKFLVQ